MYTTKFKWGLILLLPFFGGVSGAQEISQCLDDSANVADLNAKTQPKKWHRNDKAYLSPYRLNNSNSNSNFTIIDTRAKQRFDSYHIQGAFSLPKFKLVTKSIFAKKNIVLVGYGSDYKQLEILRAKLQDRGFTQVSILDGGMNFWKTKIKSKQLSDSEYKLINIDKMLGGDRTNWQIINATNNSEFNEHIANVISINADMILNPQSLSKSLFINKPLIGNIILVLDADEKNAQKIHKLWQSTLNHNIYLITAKQMLIATNTLLQKQSSKKKRTDGAKMACMQ